MLVLIERRDIKHFKLRGRPHLIMVCCGKLSNAYIDCIVDYYSTVSTVARPPHTRNVRDL